MFIVNTKHNIQRYELFGTQAQGYINPKTLKRFLCLTMKFPEVAVQRCSKVNVF